jgi:tRNA A-37 threonylcarbamoyl transferase component Bud32
MNDPLIGQTIGKYRIVEHLGRGGMAEVYKAYQPNLDRYVAVKRMHAFLSDEKEFLARFEREAKVVATLRHPNIVQVYDFDVEGGVYYMVMEYINGESLKARLQNLEGNGEWVSLDDAARIVLAVGSALKYAHERGMVHRDVKPANVMITLDGQVILTDFGIAKIVSASNLTASGAMVGTPSYMAPEQGMGQPGDERSDIYSLGVMLYQLVVGRLPFDADTPLAVVLKHINDPLPLPKALKPDLSDELDQVIQKTLAKEPDDRYQKVGDLTADLRKAMGMSPEDSHPDAAKGSAIKLAGATMVGRVAGGVTPPPQPAPVEAAPEQSRTQVAAPKTVVAQAAAVSPAVQAVPVAAKKRPGWITPAIIIAVLAIVGLGAAAVMSGMGVGASPPAPTATTGITSVPSSTEPASTSVPAIIPLTDQLQQLQQATELRDKAGSDPSSRAEGLLPGGVQFFIRARTADAQWVRIQTPDGVTGWIEAKAAGLAAEQLEQLPVATTLTRLTDTPMPTVAPTETPTFTATPLPTKTTAPTRTTGPTKAPITPRSTTAPQATAALPATPTAAAATEPLGYGFDFQFCTYDGDNYTCNVTVWGSGGDGKYHFMLENPDTGNWDEKTGNLLTYLMRSRRCRVKVQQLRIWDESGNHLEPNLTMDPGAMSDKFPGGGCTP